MHLPSHFPTRLTGAAAIACAAALTPVAALAATGNPAAPAPAASTPRCVTPGLVIWLDVPQVRGVREGDQQRTDRWGPWRDVLSISSKCLPASGELRSATSADSASAPAARA